MVDEPNEDVAKVTLTLSIADVPEFQLLVWELRQLSDDMRVAADPFSDRLEHALDRWGDAPDPRS